MNMNFLDIIILSIVEGVTEFLPVSSTAHLSITQQLLGIGQTEFMSSFIIAIQFGAILAVAVLFLRRFLQHPTLLLKMAVAFIPLGIVGFFLYPIIKHVFLGNIMIMAGALFFGGIVLLLFGRSYADRIRAMSSSEYVTLSYKEFFYLGCWQILSIIPGVSRSGSIIVGGLVHRLPMDQVVLGAFFLALPTMTVATGYDLLQTGFSFSSQEWWLLGLGVICSAVVAFFVARFFIAIMKKPYALYVFGWYRIILAVLLLIFLGNA